MSSAGPLFSPSAVSFLGHLHAEFEPRRRQLLRERRERAEQIRRGSVIDFLPETEITRLRPWRVAPAPADLNDRRVEITGPVDAKTMINALNSGASVYMADFEDATSPTWGNIVRGHINLQDAVRGTLEFDTGTTHYKLRDKTAVLSVRPRGWHLQERQFKLQGCPVSASLFDFGLHFFHNAAKLIERGSGPYFYLPKLESRHEARLWNDVFNFAQDHLKIPRGTIRATVLVETVTAAFEMEEILYELREHASGLNAGRWDYLFSMIKRFSHRGDIVFPDRSELKMTVPFLRAYEDLLIETCHKRGAHAIGGMSAYVPSRRDPAANEVALDRVREEKRREAAAGFDGAWVAHPDLVPVVRAEFDRILNSHPHQKHRRTPVLADASALWPRSLDGTHVTREGFRGNVHAALVYICSWLEGTGAVAINGMMEDRATAEVARAQLWHWIHHRQVFDDGTLIDPDFLEAVLDAESAALARTGCSQHGLSGARRILRDLVLDLELREFFPSEVADGSEAGPRCRP